MGTFELNYEWESPEGAQGPELRATWARLEIIADDKVVTKVEDVTARSTRNGIYAPLYPLAEWIAENWWTLLHEVTFPHKMTTDAYKCRHAFIMASEGFALPNLWIKPEDERIIVEWADRYLPGRRVNFISRGKAFVARPDLEASLGDFVSAVVSRLENQGVHNTFLQEEWTNIQQTDMEERAFCEAMGRLGEDPYSLEDSDAAEWFLEFCGQHPKSLVEEFLAASSLPQMRRDGGMLMDFFAHADLTETNLEPLRALRSSVLSNIILSGLTPSNDKPWEYGYGVAKLLRSMMGGNSEYASIKNTEKLGEFLSVDWRNAILPEFAGWKSVNAAVAENSSACPVFAIRSRHESTRLFALCRALYEYITSPAPTPALVTEAHSRRQKTNRAFAAEFIIPADVLKRHIGSVESLTQADIIELADEFETSEETIRHQVKNHNLAEIQSLVDI